MRTRNKIQQLQCDLFIIFCDSLNAPQILTEKYANASKNRKSSQEIKIHRYEDTYTDPASSKRLLIEQFYTKSENDLQYINARVLWEAIP